jgi:hypothetical protein
MNARVPLKLASADVVADYVRFFCAAMIADDGTFRLFERPDLELLHFAPDAPAGLRSRVEALARTCRIVDAPADAPDGSTYLEAVVKYSSALVEAKFRVDVKGGVEMLEDRPLATNLPVMIETFVDGIRMWRPIAVSGPPEFAAVSATAETAASDTASNAGREAEAT